MGISFFVVSNKNSCMYHRWLHQCFLERYACEKWMKKNILL